MKQRAPFPLKSGNHTYNLKYSPRPIRPLGDQTRKIRPLVRKPIEKNRPEVRKTSEKNRPEVEKQTDEQIEIVRPEPVYKKETDGNETYTVEERNYRIHSNADRSLFGASH